MFVGIDLVEIPRIADAIKNPRFVSRVYSLKEQIIAGSISSLKRQAEFYAGRFAVKEAAYKAICAMHQQLVIPADTKEFIPRLPTLILGEIETLKNDEGLPNLYFLGQTALNLALLSPIQAQVSLSHTSNLATAIVLLESALNDSGNPGKKQPQNDTEKDIG